MLERARADGWRAVGASMPARIGAQRHGLGHGEFGLKAPEGWRIKREGDGCAPAGVFRITRTFGDAAKPAWIRLPYLHCSAHHWGIDDVKSSHYNQIVDDRAVTRDWTGPETMVPGGGCYRLGAEIAHNPRSTPGAGLPVFSCISGWEKTPPPPDAPPGGAGFAQSAGLAGPCGVSLPRSACTGCP